MKAVIATCLLLFVNGVLSVEWKHSAVLDNNFLVLWTPGERDVMFEIQVKTLGYVGLGFTRDDGSVGADMVIGWVDNNGQLHLQVSVLKSVTLFPSRSLSDGSSSFFVRELSFLNSKYSKLSTFQQTTLCIMRQQNNGETQLSLFLRYA